MPRYAMSTNVVLRASRFVVFEKGVTKSCTACSSSSTAPKTCARVCSTGFCGLKKSTSLAIVFHGIVEQQKFVRRRSHGRQESQQFSQPRSHPLESEATAPLDLFHSFAQMFAPGVRSAPPQQMSTNAKIFSVQKIVPAFFLR